MQRTLIISDTHLGTPGRRMCTADRLAPLLEGIDRLIVNGDVGELQVADLRADAARQIAALQRHCDQRGVELLLMSGNHDAYISDTRHLLLADGRVLLTHGDVLHPSIAPWCADADNIAEDARAAVSLLPPELRDCPFERLKVIQHVAHRSFNSTNRLGPRDFIWFGSIPRRVLRLLHFWLMVPRWAADFAKESAPGAQVVIIGHSHHPGVWKRGKRLVINTGSFSFPARPRAVEVFGDQLTVWKLRQNHAGYCFARRPLYRHRLAPAVHGNVPLRKAS